MAETVLEEIRLAAEALEATGEDIAKGRREGSFKELLEDFTSTYATGYEPGDPESLEEYRQELYTAEFSAIITYLEEAEVDRR